MKNSCCKYRFLIPVFILVFTALFTYAVYELWNGVLTDVLGVKVITFWQALGILVLARILFGGFPFKRGGPPFGSHWKEKMIERWVSMTPEQREKFCEEMRQRCDSGPAAPEK
jgi:hypothetical protein